MIDEALSYLPEIESRSYKEAWKYLKSRMHENKILVSSLMMNLDKNSADRARLLINVRAIVNQTKNIYGFPIYEDSAVNKTLGSDNMLFINGANSM